MRETSWDYMLLGALPKNYAIFLKQNRAFQIFHSELSLMCHPLYSESLKSIMCEHKIKRSIDNTTKLGVF